MKDGPYPPSWKWHPYVTEFLFEDACNAYVSYKKAEDKSQKTLAKYQGCLTALCEFATGLGKPNLADVDVRLIERYREKWLRNRANSVNNALRGDLLYVIL